MDERIQQTVFGWALKSETPPKERDLFWLTPQGNIYAWDGDGWTRIQPPERVILKEIEHG